MKRWTYRNTDTAEPLPQCSYNTAAGWFPPTSSKDYSLQNKPLRPRSCLYHPKLFLSRENKTKLSLLQSPTWCKPIRMPARASQQLPNNSEASNYKSNTTYPVLSWQVHSDFQTFFCFTEPVWSCNCCVFREMVLRALEMSEATPEKGKRLGASPQANPPKNKSSQFQLCYHFWFHCRLALLSATLSHYMRDREWPVLGI